MRVICRGRVGVYERDGVYQLYVDDMQPQAPVHWLWPLNS